MFDNNSNRDGRTAGSHFAKEVQMHVIRLTLIQLDQQLMNLRESGGDSVVEDILEKSRTSTFIRTAVEREIKRQDKGDQLFARVEATVEDVRTRDEADAVSSSPPKDSSKSFLTKFISASSRTRAGSP
jgi:hypothetical protein